VSSLLHAGGRSRLLAATAAIALVATTAAFPAHAQQIGTAPPSGAGNPQRSEPIEQTTGEPPRTSQIRVSDKPPPGFEALDDSIETVFEINFNGRRVGATPVSLRDGRATFRDPEGIANLFPQRVDLQALIGLLSKPLPSNEGRRCLPGRTADCGVLPPGESGVIVTPETFTIDVFLDASFYTAEDTGPIYLAEPLSGPSLIQSVLFSVSTARGTLDRIRFGGTLDTIGSVGRTSLIAQTLVRDEGANLQRAVVQRLWNDRRAAAGLIQDEQSLTFRAYRVVGAEFGSFFGTRANQQFGNDTPIEIVLPVAAVVEVYRDNALIQTTRLEAGLQRIPTANLPSGSYPIRIVALDGDRVIFEENRVFTRVAGLPPRGEWAFNLRAGVRAFEDNSVEPGGVINTGGSFLPTLTDETLIAGTVSRRVGDASAVSAQIIAVDQSVFGELSYVTTQGNVVGVAAASVGTDGSYSAFAQGSLRIMNIDFNLSARHTRVGGKFEPVDLFDDTFEPYFRSEDLFTASVGVPLLGGNFSVTGSYSRLPDFEDRYSIGARYARPIDFGDFGTARLSMFGFKTDRDFRAGITISFFRRVSPRTTVFFGGGAEYAQNAPESGLPDGVFPLAEARVSTSRQFGTTDVVGQAGVSTDTDRHRAFVSADIGSNLGFANVLADYEARRGPGQDGLAVIANGFTGFTLSRRGLNLGLRQVNGQAAVTVGIETSKVPETIRNRIDEVGSYSIVIGNREVAQVTPGRSTVLVLPALQNYEIQLQPEQAPPYAVDLTRREVPLYPGNVVDLRFEAEFRTTLFGRLVGADGKAIGNARVSAGSDTVLTDDRGYFLITAPLGAALRPFNASGAACPEIAIDEKLIGTLDSDINAYARIGDVVCAR
jgi:hypothetical protein